MKIDPGYYASPRWSWEILDCAMPMTFDTYSNCAHQCVYCFAFFQRAIGNSKDAYMYHRVKAVNVEKVKRMFLEPDKYAGQFAPYIKARYVLQWGGLSDGFDWYERHFRTSLELLRFFREIDYPVSISTKGVWFLEDDEYREVLEGATNTHWKYSIITLDPLAMKKLEAGTPTSLERFEAMRQLNELGVGATTLRFRPFVIGTSEHHVDEMFALARDVGCYSVTTEFLCIEKRAGPNHRERYRRISEVVGYDVWEFYRRHSYSGSGLMRLNYDLKRPHIRKMERVAAENGLKFFVSDAHHKEASAGGGCCGLPETGPLSQWNRGQYSEAMQIAKARGEVRFSDIAGEAEWLKEIPWAGAIGYNQASTSDRARKRYHTMFDFMRDTWNNPKSWSSPARYFGGALVPSGTDDDGDVIYLYNAPFIESGERVESAGELQEKIAALREKARADGGDQGHVAYPIYLLADGREANAASLELLAGGRLNASLVVWESQAEQAGEDHPMSDVTPAPDDIDPEEYLTRRGKSDGLEAYWLLLAGHVDFGGASPRALLSAAESREAEGEPAAAPPGCTLVRL